MASKLGRWEIFGSQNIGAPEDPYIDRLRIIVTPFFSVYLHHIHRDDGETPQHDHPWWFASLVLCGDYCELVSPDKRDQLSVKFRVHKRFSLHTIKLRESHRIINVGKPLWTLVITGPPKNVNWGFYPKGEFVPWFEYDEREPISAGWPSWKKEGVIK